MRFTLSLLYALIIGFCCSVIFTNAPFHIAKLWYQEPSYHKDYENEIFVPDVLFEDLQEFETMAKQRGVKLNDFPLLVVFEPLLEKHGLAGACFFSGQLRDSRVIMISDVYKNDALMRKYVLFHELAHCRADVTVHDGKFGKMFSEFVWKINSDRQFYIHASGMFTFLKEAQETKQKK